MADTVNSANKAVTKGRGTENFAGVIGVTQLAGQAAVVGDSSIFSLIAILSGNLALLNLLPIPVLDGGALLFCAAAWFRGPTHIHEDTGSCYPHRTHRDSRALHAVIDARSGPIAEMTYENGRAYLDAPVQPNIASLVDGEPAAHARGQNLFSVVR